MLRSVGLSGHRYKFLFWIPIIALLCLPYPGSAATTGTTALLQQLGSGAPTSYGDFVSSAQAGGMNNIYRFFLEVPSGLSSLRVRIFDADIGRGATNRHDWQAGGGGASWNTSCRYSLQNPSGTEVAFFVGDAATGTNNGWITLGTVATPVAGHWRLVVNMSSTQTSGDDCNGYGISVDDGDDTSGGTEINVYAYSFIPVGERTYSGVNTVTTTLYPYVTSGCVVDWNDWDGDWDTGLPGIPTLCTYTYASRTRSVTGSYNGAGSTVWQNRAITGYETDTLASDTGLWRATLTYRETSTGGSNYGVFYVGDFNAASPPPTSQPQTYTQRIYLPSDGLGVPQKPFLAQNASYISGPNPPVSGQTTRARVEITIYNEAPRSISFSSISPITVNVPGGGVVFAEHLLVSQGTVISQPGLGGTGDVVWDPGTIAPGAYAGMSYAVDVTPSYGGQRLPVTGTPALNGTRGSYIDETGASTYNYGPLCELAVTEGGGDIPTWIAVTSLEANLEGGRPTVEWRTGAEIGTAGFFLRRRDDRTGEFELVNPSFLPAVYESPQGGIYRLEDPGVPIGRPVVYRLSEVDASGRTRIYGPYRVTFGGLSEPSSRPIAASNKKGQELPSSIPGFRKWSYRPSELESRRVQDRLRVLQQAGPIQLSGSHDRIRIAVKADGIARLDAALIAENLALSAQQVQSLILQTRLNLTNTGEQIPWLAEANGAGIYFYGQSPESAYTDRNIYFLDQGNGLAMDTVKLGFATPVSTKPTFQDTIHFEESRFAMTALAKTAQEDYWIWNYIVAGTDDKSFPISVPGQSATGQATLSVYLKGATDTSALQDHHAKIRLNNVDIGGGWWNGTDSYKLQLPFNAALLKEGKNTITVSGLLDVGAPYSVFYVDSFDLTYPRYYRAKDNILVCRGDGNSVISVEGLTEAQVMVLDVTRPSRPKVGLGPVVDSHGRLAFVPASSQNSYLVAGLSAALSPYSTTPVALSTLKKADQFAEYLIIAPEEFKSAARNLAAYRQSKGLKTQVVALEEIYDAFSGGLQSPLAVKDFLAFAYSKGTGKRPQYAVLAGKGSYDYKNYLGFGDNLIPPILARTPEGLFAADREFGDVKGEDGIPEIIISRLPVVSLDEFKIAIAKIKAYEKSNSSWPKRAIMIADDPDYAGNFRKGTETLIKLISGYSLQRIFLLNYLHAEETRAQIIGGFNQNPALVNYIGHGGLSQLANENIFNVTDIPFLQNGDRLPIAVLLTCVAGRFEVPGATSLTEALYLKDGGGIVAAVAPSGAASYAPTRQLAEELYKAVFGGGERGLGKAWLRALKNYMALGGKRYLLNTFNLIGDPALRFK